MTKQLRSIIDCAIGLLYPKQCMSCGKVLLKIEKEFGFCPECIRAVSLVGENSCMTCGKLIKDSTKELCNQCEKTHHKFVQHKGVFIYEGPMKKSMYKFKYSNCRNFAKYYGKFAFKFYGRWLASKNIEAIVPVPMYEKKKKRRGYNQAEEFAKALSELTGIPVAENVIKREKETVAMKELKGAKRKKNLLKAFKVTENIVHFRKVLIVDDIYTTGTTMDEVSKALKDGGISEVYGLSICIGKCD